MIEDDAELLRRYAEGKSEAAFAALVQRRVNFVYACAWRRVGGDRQLAEDVTQQVFTALARGARELAKREGLSGWLYTTARNASAQVVRTERRRRKREEEAHVMNEITSDLASDAEWQRLRPVIDGAMDELRAEDREAVLLRFFEGKSFGEVGAKLRLTENTARMRVERALNTLQRLLARHGITSTTTALGVALANQAGVAAPAGLAASVSGAALAAAGVASGGWLVGFMSISKLQAGIIGAVAVAGVTGYVVQAETNATLRKEIGALQGQQEAMVALRAENRQLANVAAEVEVLRRDDAELKRLGEAVAEVKKTTEENAKRAFLVRWQSAKQQLEQLLTQVRALSSNSDVKFLEQQAAVVSLPAETKAAIEATLSKRKDEIRKEKEEKGKEFNAVAERAIAARLLSKQQIPFLEFAAALAGNESTNAGPSSGPRGGGGATGSSKENEINGSAGTSP